MAFRCLATLGPVFGRVGAADAFAPFLAAAVPTLVAALEVRFLLCGWFVHCLLAFKARVFLFDCVSSDG